MNPATKLLSAVMLLFLAFPALLLQSCGSDQITVPDGATITISPSSISRVAVTDTVVDIKVIVRYQSGAPMPSAKVRISGAFAVPSPGATYQFYWKPGGDQDPTNPPVNSGFEAQTDDFGVYIFSVVIFGTSTGFTDTIFVTSGTASGSATIEATTS